MGGRLGGRGLDSGGGVLRCEEVGEAGVYAVLWKC